MNITCSNHGFKIRENDCNLHFISQVFAQCKSARRITSVNYPTRKRHAENTAQKKSFQNKLKGSEIIEIKKLEQQR